MDAGSQFPVLLSDIRTGVLPVKEMRGTLLSLAMAFPTSSPPLTKEHMADGTEFATSTSSTIFVTAIWVKGVDGAPFLE